MTQDILEKVKDDITFLLSFTPAADPADVVPKMSPMMYVTGTYEGDFALISRVKEIRDRYGIVEIAPEDEDFADAIE